MKKTTEALKTEIQEKIIKLNQSCCKLRNKTHYSTSILLVADKNAIGAAVALRSSWLVVRHPRTSPMVTHSLDSAMEWTKVHRSFAYRGQWHSWESLSSSMLQCRQSKVANSNIANSKHIACGKFKRYLWKTLSKRCRNPRSNLKLKEVRVCAVVHNGSLGWAREIMRILYQLCSLTQLHPLAKRRRRLFVVKIALVWQQVLLPRFFESRSDSTIVRQSEQMQLRCGAWTLFVGQVLVDCQFLCSMILGTVKQPLNPRRASSLSYSFSKYAFLLVWWPQVHPL